MRINHNSLALNASDHFAKINSNIAKSMERLSSGYKITSPADDAAGLAISTKLSAQIRGLDRASLNSNDGVSVIQSAEGGLGEIHKILARIRELCVQASNDVNSEEDRDSIQEEVNALIEEVTQISDTTSFNGQKLLNGELSRRTLSSEDNFKTTYLSESVNTGIYELEITAVAKQAVYTTGFSYSNDTVTEAQAGTIKVNGFDVSITEGMSKVEVFEKLQSHLNKIGIDVFSSNDNGKTEEDFKSGAPVVYKSKEYGSEEKIEISVTNPELEAFLGVKDKDLVNGSDCSARINPTDNGFSTTASFSTDGNEISVVDRNGFAMTIEVDPNAEITGGGLSTEIEVLSAGVMVIQTGANSGEQISLDIPNVGAKGLGIENLIMYTHEYASKAVEAVDEAIKKVSNIRSKLGAYENRLTDIYDNLEVQGESLTAAFSRLMDTDMAEEMTNYTQQEVLSQAAISMMQRSNERPESILQLLQN